MPQDPRLGGTGVCCLVAQPLPPVPWVHPQLCLRPLLLSRTLRLAPLDLCCERDFHGLCSRRLHVIHDFTWSSLFPSPGAPESLPLIERSGAQGGTLSRVSASFQQGKGELAPEHVHVSTPSGTMQPPLSPKPRGQLGGGSGGTGLLKPLL